MPGGWDAPVDGLERHNGMPVAAVDVSTGAARGTVYVNWIDTRNGDPDVFVAASRDGGTTWEAPVRVNDDPKGAVQMFTWMAVDPVDGSINVVVSRPPRPGRHHDRRDPGPQRRRRPDVPSTTGSPLAPFDCCARRLLRRLQRHRRLRRTGRRGVPGDCRRASRCGPPRPGSRRAPRTFSRIDAVRTRALRRLPGRRRTAAVLPLAGQAPAPARTPPQRTRSAISCPASAG